MDSSARDSSAVSSLTAALPKTPTMASSALPALNAASDSSLTPPPSSQPRETSRVTVKAQTPNISAAQLSSPPLTTLSLPPLQKTEGASPGKETVLDSSLANMTNEELRETVASLNAALQNAKTTAAHYKLQHQMSEMESGEAVERMAVEMEMARREIEVLQQADAQRRYNEQTKQRTPDPNYRQIHNDVYAAMVDEIRDLKLRDSHSERELAQARQIIDQQEGEIASLKDTVSLMRDRIRESREQMFRYRRSGTAESTPRTIRHNPYQTPSSGRYKPVNSTSIQQPGFAALLEASDMVREGSRGDAVGRHVKGVQSLSSVPVPVTPTRGPSKANAYALYTPQPSRQERVVVPNTEPPARKRTREDLTPTRGNVDYESDGTVSATDDSEAETDVADMDVGETRASRMASEMLRSPTRQIKRAKSAYNMKSMASSKLFADSTPPPPMPAEDKTLAVDTALGKDRSIESSRA